jgi:hypothetical protein
MLWRAQFGRVMAPGPPAGVLRVDVRRDNRDDDNRDNRARDQSKQDRDLPKRCHKLPVTRQFHFGALCLFVAKRIDAVGCIAFCVG